MSAFTPEWSTRQHLIDLANAEMCAAKTAALDAYDRVHRERPTGCSEACEIALRVMLDAFTDANASYSSALRLRGLS